MLTSNMNVKILIFSLVRKVAIECNTSFTVSISEHSLARTYLCMDGYRKEISGSWVSKNARYGLPLSKLSLLCHKQWQEMCINNTFSFLAFHAKQFFAHIYEKDSRRIKNHFFNKEIYTKCDDEKDKDAWPVWPDG